MLVLDACSIILLAKATVLESLSKVKRLIVGQAVYGEVLAGKEAKKQDALMLERLVEEQKIQVQQVDKAVRQKLEERYGLGAGESETIALTLRTTEAAFVTDNRQGRKTGTVLGLTPIGSPELILFLSQKKSITKEKARAALEALREFGWFEHILIDRCMEEIEHESKKN